MRKALTAFVVLALVAAAAWTGLWFYGKNRIVQEIEAQAQIFRARGGQATYGDIEIGGYPLGYTGRIASPEIAMAEEVAAREGDGTETARYAWSAPWIEASATVLAPDTLEFTFPETQTVTLDLPEMEGIPLPIALTSRDLTVTTTRDGEDIRFTGGAQTLGGSFSRLTEEAGEIAGTYALRDFTLSGKAASEQDGATGPQLALDYEIAGFDGTATIAGTDTSPGGEIAFKGGAAKGSGDSLGAETTGSGTLADLGLTLRSEQLGDEPLDIGIGGIEVATRMPNDAAPDPQPFAYRIGVETVTASDAIWAMFDPTGAFPRELDALVVDIDGDAVFTAPPSNAEAFARAMESGLPVDVTTLRLNTLTLDALGLKAAATGAGSLENDVPQGEATLGIDGFPDFMNALVKSGRIPPQQAMVVQLMMESFGKMDEGSDTIRFDFEARDGMMYVNTIPLGAAPTMP